MRKASVSYSRIADRYEQARGGEARARELADAVTRWLQPGATVCDVGAGTGIISARLAAAGMHVVAVDLSVEMLAQAKPRLPGRIAVADAAALPLRSASVDAVVFVWVLHHVGDIAATMQEARRVLRGGGRVVAVSGIALPADDDIDPIFRELDSVLRPERLRQSEQVIPAAVAAGLHLVRETTATVGFERSPNELADSIEQRMFAHLWDLDQHRWDAVVEPRVAALRRLPQPDRRRARRVQHPLWVLGVDPSA